MSLFSIAATIEQVEFDKGYRDGWTDGLNVCPARSLSVEHHTQLRALFAMCRTRTNNYTDVPTGYWDGYTHGLADYCEAMLELYEEDLFPSKRFDLSTGTNTTKET